MLDRLAIHSPLAAPCSGGAKGTLVYLYSLVERWAVKRGLDVHSVDWIIVPIHLGVHWALAVLDLRSRTGAVL